MFCKLFFILFLVLIVIVQKPSFAQDGTVIINAGIDQGPADAGELLGAYFPNPWPWSGHQDPLVSSWVEAGLTRMRAPIVFEDSGSIKVARDTHGDISLDFTDYDMLLFQITQWCKSEPLFDITWTPQCLSSNPSSIKYAFYAPARYDEWYSIVQQVVEHNMSLGFTGSSYQIWNEPELWIYWRGDPSRTDALLDQFIELYVTTYRAIKNTDPDSRVGGPVAVSADNSQYFPYSDNWGLSEFVNALKEYNTKNPSETAALDFIDWHDYGWSNKISDGIDIVERVVCRAGVPSATFPKWPGYVISEWNLGFNYYVDPAQRASYILYNLLREANPKQRRLEAIYLWPFYFFGESYLANSELIAFDAFDNVCRRPSFAAFQLLRNFTVGRYVKVAAHNNFAALAVRNGFKVSVAINNNTNESKTFDLYFRGLPFITKHVSLTTQIIDADHSVDCDGLEAGSTENVFILFGSYATTLTLKAYASALITLAP